MLVRDTANNKDQLYTDIQAHLAARAENRVFYLVPNHMKFAMELQVLAAMRQFQSEKVKATGMSGMMRMQVFSFQRLGWYLLQDQMNPAQNALSEVGLTMLLRKILLEIKDDLTIYRSEYNRLGFVQELATLFQELAIGNVDSETLTRIIADYGHPDSALVANQLQKMQELTLIYARYEAEMAQQTIQKTELYRLLQAAITDQDLTDVLVVIDGFYRFNANELAVIQALLQATRHIEVVLTLNQAYRDADPQWYELFTLTGRTYRQLYQLARQEKIPVLIDRHAGPNERVQPGFVVLDEVLCAASLTGQPLTISAAQKAEVQAVVDIWKCETPFIEAEQVANQIYQLVSTGRYRYQDIQILTRDIKQYQLRLIPHLRRNHIPYFVDDAESMDCHPLFRFMDSLYRIYTYNWRYQDIFNLLRSELLLPPFQNEAVESWAEQVSDFREVIDRTENVVIKNGYEGQRWWQPGSSWSYLYIDEEGNKIASAKDIETEQIANRLKAFLVGALQPLFDKWDDDQLTSAQALTALFQFLENYHIPKQLMQWRDQQIANNQLEEARHHEQAWQTFIDLLDEYMQLFAEKRFAVADFFTLVAIGFETATYSIIPPTIDSVTITGIDSQRVAAHKVAFVLGLTSTVLPKKYEDHSILTTEDRELVAAQLEWHQAFEPSARTKASNENFIAYKTFLAATDHLYLSYPYNQLDTKECLASPFVLQLKNWFAIDEIWKTDQHAVLTAKEQLTLGNWRSQLHHLTLKLALAKAENVMLPGEWRIIYQQLAQHADYAPAVQKIISSIHYSNTVVPLAAQQARALYGSSLQVSISQLELYNRDPFSYFLQYGLKLRERQVFELTPAQTGSYYHDVLQFFFEAAKKNQVDIGQLTPTEIDRLLQTVFATISDYDLFPQYSIFAVNRRHQYLQQHINQTLAVMIRQLVRQRRATNMQTIANEINFGGLASSHLAASQHYTLPDGTPVILRGRIDRLDRAVIATDTGPVTYLQVIDYKSGAKSIDFSDIYHGTSLQLYTYLMVALKYYREQQGSGAKILPFGAFYEHIHEPTIKISNQAEWENLAAEQITQEFKLNGFVLGDLTVLPEIDPAVQASMTSMVYPYKLNKDGTLAKQSSILSLDQFERLLAFNEQKIITTASGIMSGLIPIAPYGDDKFVPAIRDPFRSVSQFDITDIYSHYREKQKFAKPLDFFAQLAREEQTDGKND